MYASVPLAPVDDTILDIVRAAERLNAGCGLSGLLLYGERRYLQVLEGEPAPLSATVDRIRADTRHRILWETEMERDRRCVAPSLPMGYLSDCELSRLGGARSAATLAAPRASAATEAVEALLAIGAAKYPSAVHPPVRLP